MSLLRFSELSFWIQIVQLQSDSFQIGGRISSEVSTMDRFRFPRKLETYCEWRRMWTAFRRASRRQDSILNRKRLSFDAIPSWKWKGRSSYFTDDDDTDATATTLLTFLSKSITSQYCDVVSINSMTKTPNEYISKMLRRLADELTTIGFTIVHSYAMVTPITSVRTKRNSIVLLRPIRMLIFLLDAFTFDIFKCFYNNSERRREF